MHVTRALGLLAVSGLACGSAIAAPPAELSPVWLTAKLYGSDNYVAALRKVTITRAAKGGYKLNIANQFNFTCDLVANAAGDPAAVSNCVSGDPSTYADRNLIPLKCRTVKAERICQGSFSLDSKYDYTDPQSGEAKTGISKFPGTITIARR